MLRWSWSTSTVGGYAIALHWLLHFGRLKALGEHGLCAVRGASGGNKRDVSRYALKTFALSSAPPSHLVIPLPAKTRCLDHLRAAPNIRLVTDLHSGIVGLSGRPLWSACLGGGSEAKEMSLHALTPFTFPSHSMDVIERYKPCNLVVSAAMTCQFKETYKEKIMM